MSKWRLTGREYYEIGEACNWHEGTSGVPYYVELALKAQLRKVVEEMSNQNHSHTLDPSGLTISFHFHEDEWQSLRREAGL